MYITEKVSPAERLKRSQRMHAAAHKLFRIKKTNEKRFASPARLKKRAHVLAHMILIQKMTGLSRTQYQKLSLSQKAHIAEIIEKIPKKTVAQLAKKMLPVVTKAEKARVKAVRTRSLNEGAVSLRQRANRAHAARINTHKRSAHGYKHPHRHADKGLTKAGNRHSRERMISQMFPDKGERSSEEERVIQTYISTGQSSKALRRMASSIKRRKHDKRADLTRLSTPKDGYGYNKEVGVFSKLVSSYEYDTDFHTYLIEGDIQKFEKLFIRGLIDKRKIDQYRRIFKDVTQNIKYQRYQKDIAEMLNRLIGIITKNDNIYNHIRTELQREKFSDA